MMDVVKCPECGFEILILSMRHKTDRSIERHAHKYHKEKADAVIKAMTEQLLQKIGDEWKERTST